MNNLKSRKLWLCIIGIATAIGTGLAGEVDWPEVAKSVTAIVIGYTAVEGVVDAASANRKGNGNASD